MMSHRIFTLMTSWQAAVEKLHQRLNTLVVVNFNNDDWTNDDWWLCYGMFSFRMKIRTNTYACSSNPLLFSPYRFNDCTLNSCACVGFRSKFTFPFRSVIWYLTHFKYRWAGLSINSVPLGDVYILKIYSKKTGKPTRKCLFLNVFCLIISFVKNSSRSRKTVAKVIDSNFHVFSLSMSFPFDTYRWQPNLLWFHFHCSVAVHSAFDSSSNKIHPHSKKKIL